MLSNNFNKKYLKYKNKYLKLKSQTGGAAAAHDPYDVTIPDECPTCTGVFGTPVGCRTYKFFGKCVSEISSIPNGSQSYIVTREDAEFLAKYIVVRIVRGYKVRLVVKLLEDVKDFNDGKCPHCRGHCGNSSGRSLYDFKFGVCRATFGRPEEPKTCNIVMNDIWRRALTLEDAPRIEAYKEKLRELGDGITIGSPSEGPAFDEMCPEEENLVKEFTDFLGISGSTKKP